MTAAPRRSAALVLAALLLVLLPAGQPARAAEPSLVIAMGGEVTSLDPHYHAYLPNVSFALHVFDGLTAFDAGQSLRPALAEHWRQVSPTVWEFALRRGVRFHDGSPFRAVDAVASIRRALGIGDSPFPVLSSRITMVEAVDAATLRITTAEPDLLLPEQLTRVAILPESQVHRARAEFDAGEGLVGTGPFRFRGWTPGKAIELEAFDGHWAGAPHWRRVTLRLIDRDADRVAALIAGEVQVVNRVPPADLARLRGNAGITVSTITSQRLIYLALDSDRATTPFARDAAGQPLASNPLRDVRVRRAISLAINRDDLVQRLLEGQGVAAGQFLPLGAAGISPVLAPDPHDPVAARRLLAEAGWGRGFSLTLHGPSNRYINDVRVVAAIAMMLRRVGIDAQPVALPSAEFFPRASSLEFSALFAGLSSLSSETSDLMRALVATYDPKRRSGVVNRGRYSNSRVDDLLAQAANAIDGTERARLLRQAAEIALGEVAIVPLYHERASWAARDGLVYTPRVDEFTLAIAVTPP